MPGGRWLILHRAELVEALERLRHGLDPDLPAFHPLALPRRRPRAVVDFGYDGFPGADGRELVTPPMAPATAFSWVPPSRCGLPANPPIRLIFDDVVVHFVVAEHRVVHPHH